MRRIVCAAIRSRDGEILIGIRHYSLDMIDQIYKRFDGGKFHNRNGLHQGFVDQHGEYMTREEAYDVANAAGQIINLGACRVNSDGTKFLYSEALY